MKWIKYQIVCNTINTGTEDEPIYETVLLEKKVGYSEVNLTIAEAEAYNGYEIIDEDYKFEDIIKHAPFIANKGNEALANNSVIGGFESIIYESAHESAGFGKGLKVTGAKQFVSGRYNIEDTPNETNDNEGNYAKITGNGIDDANRSNVETLDWDGNYWCKGSLSSGAFAEHKGKFVVVGDNGKLEAAEITTGGRY